MKWTVLSDNRSLDCQLETEHGLSILLETTNEHESGQTGLNVSERGELRRRLTAHHRILLDTGASGVFIRNAERMGIDLSIVDYVLISHGHYDHAGGLRYFMSINNRAKVIISPDALSGRFYSKRECLHSITTEWPKDMQERLLPVIRTQEIADGICVIAHIPQVHPLPKGNRNLFVRDDKDVYIHDDFRHELALYVNGLLFTGCAHSGIENILAACPRQVNTVIGGFHLLDGYESKDELKNLAQRLKANFPQTLFYTSHCTGEGVFEVMKGVMGEHIQSFKCGSQMKIDSSSLKKGII